MKELVQKQFDEHVETSQISAKEIPELVAKAAEIMVTAFKDKKRLYACGNGGSTCDSMHLVEEIVAQYKNRRPALPAQNLMDPSIMTCWANDEGFDDIFKRQVEAYGTEGDVLVAISTSGNSENCIRALEQAKKQGLKTIFLSGKTGGKTKGIADLDIIIPSNTTARVQEMHILIIHSLLEVIDKEMFGV